jgi:hypothetical protein
MSECVTRADAVTIIAIILLNLCVFMALTWIGNYVKNRGGR